MRSEHLQNWRLVERYSRPEAGRGERSRSEAATERRLRRTPCTPQGGAKEPTKEMGRSPRPAGGLPIDEIRRATFQKAGAVGVTPGDELREWFAAKEGPHGGAIDEEVLDVLGFPLAAVALA